MQTAVLNERNKNEYSLVNESMHFEWGETAQVTDGIKDKRELNMNYLWL